VEGVRAGTSCDDCLNHCVHVLEYVASRDAQNPKLRALKHYIPGVVTTWLIAKAMPFAIDFDYQPAFEAGKIDSDRAHRKLPAKFQAFRARTQDSPQQNFGQAHFAAQAAGAIYLLNWCDENRWGPSTMLRMVPLPGSGRI